MKELTSRYFTLNLFFILTNTLLKIFENIYVLIVALILQYILSALRDCGISNPSKLQGTFSKELNGVSIVFPQNKNNRRLNIFMKCLREHCHLI